MNRAVDTGRSVIVETFLLWKNVQAICSKPFCSLTYNNNNNSFNLYSAFQGPPGRFTVIEYNNFPWETLHSSNTGTTTLVKLHLTQLKKCSYDSLLLCIKSRHIWSIHVKSFVGCVLYWMFPHKFTGIGAGNMTFKLCSAALFGLICMNCICLKFSGFNWWYNKPL